MKVNHKPTVLLLTSSFPRSPDDETCGYIRDFARSISDEFKVAILAPPDRSAVQWPPDRFTLTRSRSLLPRRLDPFQAGADLNNLASGHLVAKLAALVSLFSFFVRALTMATRADAICSHWMVPSGLIGALICRVLRKPHVVVEHSGALHLLARSRGGRWIGRFIVEASDSIVTVSADLNRKLVALCPAAKPKSAIIPMGVDYGSRSIEAIAAEPSPRTILFIGRLVDIKGLDVLLRAMDRLDGSQLIVAGDGECRHELESLARTLSVNARFVGRVGASERARLLSNCAAVVIPSRILADGRTEGLPVICLEAMAAGRVVIASRVGGLAEAIVDGENGLHFDQGDDRMLREKMSLALNDELLRRKIEGGALRSAADYDWAQIGRRYSAIINRAIRKRDVLGDRTIEASSISR